MAKEKRKRGGATLAEVAVAAGVSKMTASRVLRNAAGFSDNTRDRVMREVKRLGYVPNRIAAAFGSDQTSTLVGVCVPRLTSGLFGSVLDSIDHSLSKFGYQTMIGTHEQSPSVEETWLRAILAWRPAGVILSGRTHTRGTIEILRAQSIPVVEVWNLNTSPLDVSVGFNHFDCGLEMGNFILSKGHQNIAYVGAEATAAGMGVVRQEGFKKALQNAGRDLATSEVLADRPSFYAGFYGTENVLNRTNEVDAIYYQDDTMAVGGLFYCKSKGLSVPDDIGIAGWGGMEVASVLPERLTTTTVTTQALGKAAAEALVARVRNEPVQDVTVAATRLVPGNTV